MRFNILLIVISLISFSAQTSLGFEDRTPPCNSDKISISATKQPVIPVVPDDEDAEPSQAIYVPPEPVASVTVPTSDTVWEHGESRCNIEWTGLDGDLVKIILYKDGSVIDELTSWVDNEEQYSIAESIPSNYGSGTGFRVLVEDNLGNQVWSDNFSILAQVRVTEPGWGSEWSTGQEDILIEWVGAPGSRVKLELLRNDEHIANITSDWILNTGEYFINYPVPAAWGTGDGYRIQVRDDLGNKAVSSSFPIYGILVTSPSEGTIWSDLNPDIDVTWVGGTRVVRLGLYRGNDKISDISSWIDNTGYFRVEDMIALDLEQGSNYRIAVEDDQGNLGFSEPIMVQYSSHSLEGALSMTGRSFNRYLMPGETIFYSTYLLNSHYQVNISSRYNDYEISFLDGDANILKTINSPEDDIGFARNVEYIRVENNAAAEDEISCELLPLERTTIARHRFYFDAAYTYTDVRGYNGGFGYNLSYSFALNDMIDIGLEGSMYGNEVYQSKPGAEGIGVFFMQRFMPAVMYTFFDPRNDKDAELVVGLGYSFNHASLSEDSLASELLANYDMETLERDGITIMTGARWDFSNHLSIRANIGYCPANMSFYIQLTPFILGVWLGDESYIVTR